MVACVETDMVSLGKMCMCSGSRQEEEDEEEGEESEMFCRRPNLYVSRNDVGERTIKLEGNDSDSEGAPQTRPDQRSCNWAPRAQ